ncbi:hypothetical protein OF385_13565 [Glutamicibacter sp. JL.03c]|uniref:hypothetical protein n=1 Tax=Glutamicibacter sp. JL.03c TaxID=2984842 RepID=UPI0021F748C4|nr:hypothetical protein [Glutamicibacter sp. JL.03c]UYQ77032.1 hypothetical protein OF385_13565 [Glutamicibacter sp. JL.03c]
MEDLRLGRCSVRSTLSARAQEAILILEELKLRGYCLLTYRVPRSSPVIVSTVGLGCVKHPEISISTGLGKHDVASGLLRYLAEQVLQHGKEFTAGCHGSSFYGEFVFRGAHCGMDLFDGIDDGYEEVYPDRLVCSLPAKSPAPSHGQEERCQVNAAWMRWWQREHQREQCHVRHL